MPRWAWNRAPAETKRRYFELIRGGASSQAASLAVGVSPSCGSLWFIDAGRVHFVETPISPRYLSQDDRIERSPATASRTVATTRGSRTTGPTSVDAARARDGSWLTPSCASW
jgi:IS30 family transposase